MFIPTRKFFKPFNAALAALLLACAAPAWAEDIEAQFRQANAAYQAGNYQQAFHLMQPPAQRGFKKRPIKDMPTRNSTWASCLPRDWA